MMDLNKFDTRSWSVNKLGYEHAHICALIIQPLLSAKR